MDIKNLTVSDLAKNIDRSATDRIHSGDQTNGSVQTEKRVAFDQIEISEEARALQRAKDEFKVSKELLNSLPSTRAHVIYEALAKLKAGHYSSEEIVSEAAAKLMAGGELDDILSA